MPTIRDGRRADLDQIVERWVELMAAHAELHPELYRPASHGRGTYRTYLRERIDGPQSAVVVAEADGQIQGYIMCRIERGLSKFKSLRPARLCHVVSIAVREPYRRQGIAKGIMLVAMEKGQETYEASECYLEVRISNGPALVLYEKLGFTKIKRNYSYYMNGEDAWMMAIRIQIPA